MSELQSQPSARFEDFRRRMLNDPLLLERLRATASSREFVESCIAVARELKIELTAGEIESALNLARRDWIERWPP